MPRFLPDTSSMVAALCGWHAHHERAVREIERRLDSRESLVMAAPALVETYSVLTRLPPPHRLSPFDCLKLLESDFLGPTVEVVALAAEAYHRLLGSAPDHGVAGGAIYDAVILACARAGKADVLLTFNERQFRRLSTGDIEVVVPP